MSESAAEVVVSMDDGKQVVLAKRKNEQIKYHPPMRFKKGTTLEEKKKAVEEQVQALLAYGKKLTETEQDRTVRENERKFRLSTIGGIVEKIDGLEYAGMHDKDERDAFEQHYISLKRRAALGEIVEKIAGKTAIDNAMFEWWLHNAIAKMGPVPDEFVPTQEEKDAVAFVAAHEMEDGVPHSSRIEETIDTTEGDTNETPSDETEDKAAEQSEVIESENAEADTAGGDAADAASDVKDNGQPEEEPDTEAETEE